MPRVAVDDNERMNLRIKREQKAMLLRAAALKNTDLTDFLIQNALREAELVIEEADRVKLSGRDSLRVLEFRVRTDHAPANFTTMKHMAHNLIRKAPGKDSLRVRRKLAAWGDEFLASLIAA